MGLVNFYRHFIPNTVYILQPLHQLLHDTKDGKTKLCCTNEATLAFEASKQALASATLLSHPKLDAPTSIMCDALNTAIRAVLQQGIKGQCCPTAYFSKQLHAAQKQYSTFDQELLVIYQVVKPFWYFVKGRQFMIFTDHKPLTCALLASLDRYCSGKFDILITSVNLP